MLPAQHRRPDRDNGCDRHDLVGDIIYYFGRSLGWVMK